MSEPDAGVFSAALLALLLLTLLLLLLSVDVAASLASLYSLGVAVLSEELALLELAECDSSLETSVLDSSCAHVKGNW